MRYKSTVVKRGVDLGLNLEPLGGFVDLLFCETMEYGIETLGNFQ